MSQYDLLKVIRCLFVLPCCITTDVNDSFLKYHSFWKRKAFMIRINLSRRSLNFYIRCVCEHIIEVRPYVNSYNRQVIQRKFLLVHSCILRNLKFFNLTDSNWWWNCLIERMKHREEEREREREKLIDRGR